MHVDSKTEREGENGNPGVAVDTCRPYSCWRRSTIALNSIGWDLPPKTCLCSNEFVRGASWLDRKRPSWTVLTDCCRWGSVRMRAIDLIGEDVFFQRFLNGLVEADQQLDQAFAFTPLQHG